MLVPRMIDLDQWENLPRPSMISGEDVTLEVCGEERSDVFSISLSTGPRLLSCIEYLRHSVPSLFPRMTS
jgi:hypothetical protein